MVGDKDKIEDLFAAWLARNVPSAHLSELYLCYSEIEAYCLKTKVLRKPLFETTDLDTVKRAQKTVTESRIFQLSHKKQMRKIVSAAHYYTAFVKSLTVNAVNATEKSVSQNIPNVSLGIKLTEAAQRNESTSIENKRGENLLQIDFLHLNNLEYTKPVSFAYFGDEHTGFSHWKQLYVKVLVCLSEDYPDEFLRMYNTNISGGRRIDFGTQKAAERMNDPKKVSDNFYVETNLSTTGIVSKIRLLLDRCNVDYGNLEICYIKIRPTQQAEPVAIENAPMPTASVVSAGKDEPSGNSFDSFFEDEKYEPLYKKLKENGITTPEKLKEINLWSFMNLHQLYSIRQRLAISTELTAKLRETGKEDNEQNTSTYEIYYNDVVYKDTSPSKVFVAFLTAIATRYPLKFRTLLDSSNPESHKIVIRRRDHGNTKLKLMNPEAYVDSDLSLNQVKQYMAWVIKRCNAVPSEYIVEEGTTKIETKIELPRREPAELPAENPKKASGTFATDLNTFLTKEAEDYLLRSDLTGAAYDELHSKLRCKTMVVTKEVVAQSPRIIEMNRRLYHVDALVDFEEGADTLERVLDKLLKMNNGIVTAKLLYEYARSEKPMFFNDNGITDQQSVYDLARYLFAKLKYHGKQYVFKSNMYISLPDVSADSVIDIVRKYAEEKGSSVKFKEIESYLAGLGANTGNLRGQMRIDKEPVFLVYAENEYLLAELMHIDAAFLESTHSALRRLFADSDGHIIPRNISDSWYKLLPTLPDCLPWTPMLLQQLIRFYPHELEARTIIAMESQNSNTLHAMFVEKDSWIQDFRDVVAVFLHNEMPNRCEFEAEELREILVDAGMISGNQLIYNMPNALGGDPRFLWDSDGNCVKVRI